VPLLSLIGGAIIWALAELLVARLRLVLPGILLVCFFAVFIMLAAPVDFSLGPSQAVDSLAAWFVHPRQPNGAPNAGVIWPLILIGYMAIGVAATALFYARFRLPFALLLISGGIVTAVLAWTQLNWPLTAKYFEAYVLLACGLAVFVAAMAFDASDRERLTRRADCAFWLHLLAAPLIVHSLVELVWQRGPGGSRFTTPLTTETAVAIAVIVAALAVVAIITDRRALLVSALTYLGIIIGYAITRTIGQQDADKSFVVFATLVVLGALVVALGVGWQPMRRVFLALLPAGFVNRLPPAAIARAKA